MIGDIPYGDAQIAAFPGRISQINADPQVQLVDHLGDIKSGSSLCWVADREAGRSTIMMAASNAAVAGLNARAHTELRATGAVSGEATPLRDDQSAGVGDVVLTRRNDRRITIGHRGDRVRNGSLFTVRAIGRSGSLTVQRVGGDAVTTLPADYVTAHVDLGYASTIDRAQGITVDTARVIAHPGMTRQQLYAAMSRGRAENHAHIEVEQQLDVDVERAPDARTDSAVVLRQIIARDGAERSATETLHEEMDAPHRLKSLVPESVHAVETLSTGRHQAKQDALIVVFGGKQAAAMLADPGGAALLAELNHHSDMAAAVAAAAGELELGTAESVAQVMQWRLQKLRHASDDENRVGPLPWLPTVPDAPKGELRDWTVRRAQAITDRSEELGGIVASNQPAWAAALGHRQAEPAPARDWERAAALAAAYREQFAVTDEWSILGLDQPGKGRMCAEVFVTAAAVTTGLVGAGQPGNSHPIAHGEPVGARSELFHVTDDLMPRGDFCPAGRQIALRQVQIGAADPATSDTHPDLARTR